MENRFFINRIDTFCEAKDITKAQMLRDLQLPDNLISAWKKRGTIPAADVLYRIAKYFGVPMEYLLAGEDDTLPDDIAITIVKLNKLSPEQRKPIIQMVCATVDSITKD